MQTTEDKQPVAIQLRRVKGFRKTELARYAHASLSPECTVWSDGLGCFNAVSEAGCEHISIVTGSTRRSAQHPTFKWVNTMLGNVKNAITGTFHSINKKHVPRYLAEFEYRFNRRYDLPAMVLRLAYAAVRTQPMPYRRSRWLRLMDNQQRFCLAHSLLPLRVGGELNRSTRPLCSEPITGSSTLLQVGPPPVCASVLWALIFFSWPSPFASQSRVPAVPHKSLDRARAISMPDTVHPVSRLPMDLSRR